MSQVLVSQPLEQLPAGYSDHLVVYGRPLGATPLGTEDDKIAKLGRYFVHDSGILSPESSYNKPAYPCCGGILPLKLPCMLPWSRLRPHRCPLPLVGCATIMGEQTCKPSSVPRSYRDGDHPSSPDVAIRVKRPTRGPRPSTLDLPQSPKTLERPAHLFGLAPGGVCPASQSPGCW